jgi:hypothetical protein
VFQESRLFTGCPRWRRDGTAVNLGVPIWLPPVPIAPADVGGVLDVLRGSHGLALDR